MHGHDFKNYLVTTSLLALFLISACKSTTFTSNSRKQEPATVATPQPQPINVRTPMPQPTTLPIMPMPPISPPVPPTAVTKGSFTVWADPTAPAPRQPYNIHIRVVLPSNITTFDKFDISGHLIGTDQYQQIIPRSVDQFLFGGSSAEYIISVPGAEDLVEDTIQIQCPKLNEYPTLVVVFGKK